MDLELDGGHETPFGATTLRDGKCTRADRAGIFIKQM
jgi:hypothetical protein